MPKPNTENLRQSLNVKTILLPCVLGPITPLSVPQAIGNEDLDGFLAA